MSWTESDLWAFVARDLFKNSNWLTREPAIDSLSSQSSITVYLRLCSTIQSVSFSRYFWAINVPNCVRILKYSLSVETHFASLSGACNNRNFSRDFAASFSTSMFSDLATSSDPIRSKWNRSSSTYKSSGKDESLSRELQTSLFSFSQFCLTKKDIIRSLDCRFRQFSSECSVH